ncbi:MAG: hypothetical protein Q4C75_01335 [Bergeyella zoohelcum]|nr:hypothetical protein [Bergeyella zoohelcum]
MKKEISVLLATSLGFFATIGFLSLKKQQKERAYNEEYEDFHRNFSTNNSEESHGVEYLAMI